LSQKQKMLAMLDKCLNADGVQIFIGDDCPDDSLAGCSLVTAPYQAGGETVGVLGVIGPLRLAYDEVVPIVDVTAKILSAALNS